jgi:NADH-quinone oxidoreductase subunit M
MLWTFQRVFLGNLKEKWSSLKDLTFREYAMLVPLSLIVIFLGVYPAPMLNLMNASVNAMVKFMAHAQTIYSQFASF